MYSIEKVKSTTLQYFEGDSLAADKWIEKYCLKNEEGGLLELSPDDMHRRMAKEFARIEATYPNSISEEEIYNLLKDFKYVVPGGSQEAGIGNNLTKTSLSNCFVIDSAVDSYGGIYRTDEEQVQLMKRRGGVGHDLSGLRPGGMLANNSVLSGLAGQPLYMERYSNSTREVAQDGRRGALMLSTHINHPDVGKFIDMKLETGKVTGANISVKITDNFMNSLESNKDFTQRFPVEIESDWQNRLISTFISANGQMKKNELYLLDKGISAKKIDPKELWDKIIYNAWKSAEPGVLFWDTILRESPAGCYGKEWKETSTNPCAEIPLCPYDSCRLTAVNLYSYVKDPFTSFAVFDFELFKKHVNMAQRLMDDLIDLEVEKIDIILDKIANDPEEWTIKEVEYKLWMKVRDKAIKGRRTGLGITAEGDMIAALGLCYGTEEATDFSVELHRIMAIESYNSSIEMAEERGAFPICNQEIETSSFLDRIYLELDREHQFTWETFGRRNIANLTIAPVGTGSLMTQSTSGIEPLFQAFYKRRAKTEDKSKIVYTDEMGDGWQEYFVIHPKFKVWYDINWYKTDLKLFDLDFHKPIEDYSEEELQKLFEKSPYYKATANDIDWKASVEMQGAVQKWIDHSISKTVNLPNDATIETVDQVYRTAFKSGCKGVTVYRDGCRQGVLLTGKEKKNDIFEYSKAFKRPKVTECDIYHKTALKKNWMVIVGKVDKNPYEIFVVEDVENHVFPFKIEKGTITKIRPKVYELTGVSIEKTYKIGNLINLMSEDEGVGTRKYSSMLRHGMAPIFIVEQIREFATISSFDKVVQRVLENYSEERNKEKCPECGSTEYHVDSGCWKCPACGYSKCG